MEMSRRVRHCVEMIPMLHVVEVRCGVRDVIGTIMQDLVEVSCCVRHSVEVIAVLHIVVVRSRVWNGMHVHLRAGGS